MCGPQSGCLLICLLSAGLHGGAGYMGLLVLLRAELQQKLTGSGSKRGVSASQGHWDGRPRVHRALSGSCLSDTACQSALSSPCTLALAPCTLALLLTLLAQGLPYSARSQPQPCLASWPPHHSQEQTDWL